MRTVFEILGPQAHFEVRRCRVQKKHRSDESDIYSRAEASAAAIIKKLLLTSIRIIEQRRRPSIDDEETTDQDEIRRTSQQDHRGEEMTSFPNSNGRRRLGRHRIIHRKKVDVFCYAVSPGTSMMGNMDPWFNAFRDAGSGTTKHRSRHCESAIGKVYL